MEDTSPCFILRTSNFLICHTADTGLKPGHTMYKILITPLTPGLNPVTQCTKYSPHNVHNACVHAMSHFMQNEIKYNRPKGLCNNAYVFFITPTKLVPDPNQILCTMSPTQCTHMFMRTLIIAIILANVTLQLVPLGHCYRQ